MRRFILVLFVTVGLTSSVTFSQSGFTLLDDFEDSTIRVVLESATNPLDKYLWGHYPAFGSSGTASLSTDGVSGNSLMTTVYPSADGKGDMYTMFRPLVNNGSGIGNMRQFVQPSSSWQMNHYNRVRFWIKVPPGYPQPFESGYAGIQTMNIGTYVRGSQYDGTGNQEAGGAHYYHFYNLPYTGEWHQIVWDFHPTATRMGTPLPDGTNANGETELWGGSRGSWTQFPTQEAGYNYFDALTSFYLSGNAAGEGGGLPANYYPLVFKVDGFEVYQETAAANINQVYSLNAVYRKSDNYLHVGWNRRKDEYQSFDVRYAFSSIYETGWNSATPAPGGTAMMPPVSGGQNLMKYETRSIPVGSNSILYIAIKPQNSSSFHQISVPLNVAAGSSSPPSPPSTQAPPPPTNLRIVG